MIMALHLSELVTNIIYSFTYKTSLDSKFDTYHGSELQSYTLHTNTSKFGMNGEKV